MSLYVPFLGVVNVPIKTYTTNYVSVSGGSWNFNSENPQPMDFQVWGSLGTTIGGFKANLFARANITPIVSGAFTGAINSEYGAASWFNNKLCVVGILPGSVTSEPNGYAIPAPLDGIGSTTALPAPVHLASLPSATNTSTPSPFLGWGGLGTGPTDPFFLGKIFGARFSVRNQLTDLAGVWDGAVGILLSATAAPPFDSSFSPLTHCIADPVTGFNNITMASSGGAETAPAFTQTTLLNNTSSLFNSVQYQNPPGSFAMDTYMHVPSNKGAFTVTAQGFLKINTDSITVNGATLAGYGILILPQLSGYYILNITGTDALSLTWATAAGKGQLWGAMGASGDLFVKWNNDSSDLFISGAPVVLPTVNPNVSTLRQRAWSFTLDGHTFYVLDLGAEGTFLYDITTKQWTNFTTQGFTQWDAANGVMWGNRIIAGDLLTSDVWEVAGSATQDNAGTLNIPHVATGALTTRSREFHSVEDVRLAVSKGYYDAVLRSIMYLRYSDDGGTTWSAYLPHVLTEGLTKGSLSWRSLGAFQAPGRIFEFSDSGGPFRIDGADVYIDNFDEETAPPAQSG